MIEPFIRTDEQYDVVEGCDWVRLTVHDGLNEYQVTLRRPIQHVSMIAAAMRSMLMALEPERTDMAAMMGRRH